MPALEAVTFDRDAADVAARVRRSVVAVLSNGGAGSGVAWADGRTVVTNHHVAREDTVRIIDHTGHEQPGTVVAREPAHDLAIIRIEGPLEPAAPGDPLALRPGQRVFAIGNPLGLRGVVTAGVILARPAADQLIRAHILLQPGNSGGPLVTADGRVVGINSMVNGGMGMAVPAALVDKLAETSAEPAGVIGFSGAWVPGEDGKPAGLLLTEVFAGSPAESAGLIPGDLILAIDGVELASGRARVRAGSTANIEFVRAASRTTLSVVAAPRD